VQLIHDALGALLKADETAARQLFEESVALHYPGRGPLAAELTGLAEVIGWMQKMPTAASGGVSFTLGSSFADEQRGVILFVMSVQKDSQITHQRTIAVFAVRNGKVAEIWATPMDLYASDELLAVRAERARP